MRHRTNIFVRIVNKAERVVNHTYNHMIFRKNQVICGENVTINGKIIISCEIMNDTKIHYPTIVIGNSVKINSGLKFNLIGGETHTILRTVDNGQIMIGDGAAISNVTIVSHVGVVLEEQVMIGGDVRIYDSDFHSLKYEERLQSPDCHIISKKVVIKKGAFVGAGSIILKGVTIGEKSIIGAGSVVTCDIPGGEIWGGNPCRYIRRTEE